MKILAIAGIAICTISVVGSVRTKRTPGLKNRKINLRKTDISSKKTAENRAAFLAKRSREGRAALPRNKTRGENKTTKKSPTANVKQSKKTSARSDPLPRWMEWVICLVPVLLPIVIALAGIMDVIPCMLAVLAGITVASTIYHKFKTSTHMGRAERIMVKYADAMVAAVMAIFCVSTLAGLPDALSHEKWIRQVVVTLSCFVLRTLHVIYRKKYYAEAQKSSGLPREAILLVLFSAVAAVSLSISAVLRTSDTPNFAALSTAIKPGSGERLQSYIEKVTAAYTQSHFHVTFSYLLIFEALMVLYTQALIFKKFRCASEKLYRNIAFVGLTSIIALCAIWVLYNTVGSGYYSVSVDNVAKAANTSYSTTHANITTHSGA